MQINRKIENERKEEETKELLNFVFHISLYVCGIISYKSEVMLFILFCN